MTKAVKEFASKPIPFANRDPGRRNEFKRVPERFKETVSNARIAVWHIFSCSIPEVRRAGTSERKSGDIMRKTAIQSDQNARVRIKKARVRAWKPGRIPIADKISNNP
jgi:hypothetical protein